MSILGTMTVSFMKNVDKLRAGKTTTPSEKTVSAKELALAGAAVIGLDVAIKESDEKTIQEQEKIMQDMQTSQDGMGEQVES